MVFTLARETGWAESFIVWKLPLVRALEYYHAALWAAGAWTVKRGKSVSEQVANIEAMVDKLASFENPDESDDCF